MHVMIDKISHVVKQSAPFGILCYPVISVLRTGWRWASMACGYVRVLSARPSDVSILWLVTCWLGNISGTHSTKSIADEKMQFKSGPRTLAYFLPAIPIYNLQQLVTILPWFTCLQPRVTPFNLVQERKSKITHGLIPVTYFSIDYAKF